MSKSDTTEIDDIDDEVRDLSVGIALKVISKDDLYEKRALFMAMNVIGPEIQKYVDLLEERHEEELAKTFEEAVEAGKHTGAP